MTQITPEQEQQLQATAQRVGTKLRDFHNRLPADEQVMLDVALKHVTGRTQETGADVSGHVAVGVIVPIVVTTLTVSAVKNFISTTDWGAVGDALTSGGPYLKAHQKME